MEVSIFDLDKTLTKNSTSFTVARKLLFKNQLPNKSLLKYLKNYLISFIANKEMKENDLQNFINDSLLSLKNYSQIEMQNKIDKILTPILPKLIYKKAFLTLREELKEGRILILATAAPKEIADIFAKHLGFHHVISTNLEVIENQYTGLLDSPFCHGKEKTKRVISLLKELKVENTSVKAFSDSYNDLSLLTLSSNPIAVNPDSSLRKHSKSNNWEIIDYKNFRLVRKIFYSSLSATFLYFTVIFAF
jgi:HAD superfamily hydrolase (TIGR01490 family)